MDFTENCKNIFFAFRIEKTEINTLQKRMRIKAFFYFLDEDNKLFLNIINHLLRVYKFQSPLINIHRESSRMRIAV